MNKNKEPPPVCKTEDGIGDHPNMITQEEIYHSAPDLSSGGSSGDRLKSLRVSYALAARDMAETVQALYPRFDRYLLSKCEAGDQYGVELRPNALKRLYMKFAPDAWEKFQRRRRDRHRLTRSVRCRLEEHTYLRLMELIRQDGFSTVQEWLTAVVLAYIAAKERSRP